jgi:hypothetical protein
MVIVKIMKYKIPGFLLFKIMYLCKYSQQQHDQKVSAPELGCRTPYPNILCSPVFHRPHTAHPQAAHMRVTREAQFQHPAVLAAMGRIALNWANASQLLPCNPAPQP